jgi:acetyl esterase/lipase
MDVIKMVMPEVKPGDIAMPSMDVSAVKRKFLDVSYSAKPQSELQTLDIYLPDDGVGPFPTIVFIHGGAFWGGDKRDFQAVYVMNGIRRGYAVASINHRLSDTAKFPEPIYDVKAAVRFLRANASTYLLDPERFCAVGDSAGSYFAMMLGATANNPAFECPEMGNAEFSSAVQAVVGYFGVYDLVAQSEFTEVTPPAPGAPKMPNFADIFMDINCREHPALCKIAWPGSYIDKNCPPTLLQAGTADEIVPYRNSIELADKINAVCGAPRAVFEPFEGYTHGDARFGTPENEAHVFEFIDKYMKK